MQLVTAKITSIFAIATFTMHVNRAVCSSLNYLFIRWFELSFGTRLMVFFNIQVSRHWQRRWYTRGWMFDYWSRLGVVYLVKSTAGHLLSLSKHN